ncbi:heavy metal translocating P-type ATPase [Crenothrix polyspora]|uniref:P-type Zn(2+) transporter n=1 Tax=Crenothrix polyspora TaxID=360316 RepID=A0A1R4HFP4_9GAMM|nr:heavy metal translocating P-type ATPase [Crenothrix polyspora]SJM95054.1 Cation-transporting ATPase [Crenothrix polyspora]
MLIEIMGVTGLGLYAKNRLKKKTLLNQLTAQPRIIPFTGSVRNQQIREFSENTIDQKSPAQKLADRNMAVSLSSMGLATVGKLIYPPLLLLSLPGILYVTQFAVVPSYESMVKKKKLTVDFLYTLTNIFLVLNNHLFFASFSIFLYSLNRSLLAKISNDSKKSIIDVFKQQPSFIWVVYEGVEREIAFEDLKTGDTVVVSAGSTIPVDGIISEGTASVDQHILTGEFQPVEKGEGMEVFALTLVLSGKIYIHAHKTGHDTTAAQIASILNNTLSTKTDIQLWSSEFSDKTVLPTLLLSGMMLPFIGSIGAMVIVNSHFRYKASIASTIGVMNHLNAASHNGILIKNGHTFEVLKTVDTVVFDKTGTLTEEQPRVASVHACSGYLEQEVLRFAAAAETKQSHPIAKAILQQAADWQLLLPDVDETAYKLGYGLTVGIEGHIVRVGSVRFLEQEGVSIPESVRQLQADSHDVGSPMVAVALDAVAIGAIALEAAIRPGTKELIGELRERGITSMYIISGDHEAPTRKLAHELGIDHYFAETLPEQKAERVAQLQAEGKVVCYIGDGINDAIALKQADVSVSIRGASTVATDAAQIVLMDKTLNQLPYLFDIGQQFGSNMKKVVAAVIIPSVMTAGGAIFLHFGLLQSLILPQIGLLAGVAMAMNPAVRHSKKSQKRVSNTKNAQ